jgi:hypothetical protein
MCKLEGIKWAVVKSNKTISKRLSSKISKIRSGFTEENTFSFYYFNEEDFNKVIDVLNSYKNQKFEVVRFYDKQFGLTLNNFSANTFNQYSFNEKVSKMPLTHKFSWFNNSNRTSITPITKKQFDNIVQIN